MGILSYSLFEQIMKNLSWKKIGYTQGEARRLQDIGQ